MATADTTPEATRFQRAVFAGMTGPERVEMAMEMSRDAFEISKDGIRSRNPDFDDPAVHRELLRLLHGDAIAAILAPRS